jgi:mono/diheme cytochrome c family protein
VDESLLRMVLKAKDFRARSAAVRVLRYTGHQVKDQVALLKEAAQDEHGRVRLEAIVAASWLNKPDGLTVLREAVKKPFDHWMIHAYETAEAHLNGRQVREVQDILGGAELNGMNPSFFVKGKELYLREGYCGTCHQQDGSGLPNSGFPPLSKSPFVLGDEETLIKIVLKGLQGPIEVNGRKYDGQVPMTPFEGLMNDEEVAAVVSYVRNSFGNKASPVTAEKVKVVREKIKDRKVFYRVDELQPR